MTVSTLSRPRPPGVTRTATQRHYLMCPPEFFNVRYAINPWMRPGVPVDTGLAMRQWEWLRRIYESLGHRVSVIQPEPGLPDMVFAANGATVIGGKVLAARFRHDERAPEAALYRGWLSGFGLRVHDPVHVNEGEGDFLLAGDRVLAGYGMRTRRGAHREARELFGLPVTPLRLVDKRYYHLDTALSVLDERTIMYLPQAFSPRSREVLRRLYPDALTVEAADAAVLGLNATSDGRHVVLAKQATRLAESLRERGFRPLGVDVGELLKAGGGAKCCTLEIRADRRPQCPPVR